MDNEEKDMKETIDEVEPTVVGEAPESLHISGYYKGFAIGLTKRDRRAKMLPYIEDAEKAVDEMLARGWLPSWNTETNARHTNGQVTPQKPVTTHPVTSQTPSIFCPVHDMQMTQKQGKFGPFYSHIIGQDPTGKNLYCNGK